MSENLNNVSIPNLTNVNNISFAPCNNIILSDCYIIEKSPAFIGSSTYYIEQQFDLSNNNRGLFIDKFDKFDKNKTIDTYFKPRPAFLGISGYNIDKKYDTLPNFVDMALITGKTSVPLIEPAFLGTGGYDIDKKYDTLPNVVEMALINGNISVPLIEPAFLGTGGYDIDKKYDTLPNFIEMALINGNISVPLIEPAFLGTGGYDIDKKYDTPITFKDILNTESYKFYYAFTGSGTYSTKLSIDATDKTIETLDVRYDYTNTLQVFMETYKFNNKIGVIKDNSNNIINSSYNISNNTFENDIISMTAKDVFYNISANHIFKLGAFDNFYTNFIEYVNNFFGIGGFTNQLFSSTNLPPNDISNNNIVFYNKDLLSNILSSLTGNVQITGIASMINYCVIANPFNNRQPGITNRFGFLEGDKFFIKDGVTINFNLDILNTTSNDISLSSIIDNSGNQSLPQPIYNFDLSYNNPFDIKKTITTDLLIILKDNI